MNTNNGSKPPELQIGGPSTSPPMTTVTAEATPVNNNSSNSNSNSGSREVNQRHNNVRQPILNAIQRASLNPPRTCKGYLDQAALFVDLAAVDKTPGMNDYTNLYVMDGVRQCYKAAERVVQEDIPASEKIKHTNGIMKTMLEYAVYRFKSGKHRATLFQGVLDIVKNREEVLGHAEGDTRLKHDVRAWRRYVTGKGPKPGTRRRTKNTRRTRKV